MKNMEYIFRKTLSELELQIKAHLEDETVESILNLNVGVKPNDLVVLKGYQISVFFPILLKEQEKHVFFLSEVNSEKDIGREILSAFTYSVPSERMKIGDITEEEFSKLSFTARSNLHVKFSMKKINKWDNKEIIAGLNIKDPSVIFVEVFDPLSIEKTEKLVKNLKEIANTKNTPVFLVFDKKGISIKTEKILRKLVDIFVAV
ncbi:MAG: hypothetical protein ACTSXL_01270 [Alphaproteobacteria bacterium]